MQRTITESDEELMTIALGDLWKTMTEMEIIAALTAIAKKGRDEHEE
jgi:hypothetical protein